MSRQLSHSNTSFKQTKFPVVLLLDNITGEANIGSLFRLADAFGIDKIIFCGTRPNLDSNRLKRTARNTHKSVLFEHFDSSTKTIQKYKDSGFRVITLEITSDSNLIQDFNYSGKENILLVAGNERHGISEEVLEMSTEAFHIEMFGENSSMNVAQSVGIALYEITKAINQFVKK